MVYERTAGRALLIAPDRSTLLVRGRDPEDLGRGHFYWTPGGGIDDGESVEAATRREVLEEVGHVVDDLGEIVLHRVSEFDFAGRRIRQTESFFAIDVPVVFDASPSSLSALEDEAIVGFEWLTPWQMRRSPHAVYPTCLADLVDSIVEDGRPATPWIDRTS